jgi:hypothetical protein
MDIAGGEGVVLTFGESAGWLCGGVGTGITCGPRFPTGTGSISTGWMEVDTGRSEILIIYTVMMKKAMRTPAANSRIMEWSF